MENEHWSEKLVAQGLGSLQRLNGYYHENFVAQHEGQNFLIRVPRAHADDMDLRMFDENDVMRFLNACGYNTPKLIYQSSSNDFAVHEFVAGQVLSALYPKANTLSNPILSDIAGCFAGLHKLDALPLQQHSMNTKGVNGREFFANLVDYIGSLHKRLWADIPEVYSDKNFPPDPVAALRRMTDKVSAAPLVLCHGDLHQHNIILQQPTNKLIPIDWELAALAPAAFDLASHMNRAHLQPSQRDYFLNQYIDVINYKSDTMALRKDVSAFLAVEIVKSAVVDTHRLHFTTIASTAQHRADYSLNTRYPAVLAAAQAIWASDE